LDLSSAASAAVAQRPAAEPASAALGDLLLRSSHGDADSFGQLYDATVNRVYGLALRRFCRREDAELVTQHVYVTLWRQAGEYVARDGHPLAWIISLAYHETLRHQLSADSVAVSAAPTETAERPQDGPVLSRAQQEILTLVYLGGYTPRQAAELLQLDRTTVFTALRGGLRCLSPELTGRA